MFVSLERVCIVYVVKEVASFRGGLVNSWAWHVKERALELQSEYRPAGRM